MEHKTNPCALPLLPLKKVTRGPAQECLLVLGTTGTGKSSTINIYTGSSLEEGSDAESVTRCTVTQRDTLHTGAPAWVDNPGGGGRISSLPFI